MKNREWEKYTGYQPLPGEGLVEWILNIMFLALLAGLGFLIADLMGGIV